jgi:hypothetical protein
MGFLKRLGCEYLWEMTDWQMRDYKAAITGHKTMWHRSRRAGKTLGLTNIAVFFSIVQFGYRANKGKVLWRSPKTDHLVQPKFWFEANPFVITITHENNVKILDSHHIDMGCLSSGKVAGQGVAVVIEDEYRDVPKDYKIYDLAGRAEDMAAEGPINQQRYISASTGCRLTFFHDQYLSGEWTYCRHTYKECPWVTDEYVESKRKEHPEDPYFVQQEFEAVWVARGDTAFRNIYIVDMEAKTVTNNEDQWEFGDHPFFPLNWTFPTPRKAGVDFNESAGHYVGVGSVDDDAIYVNFERIVTTIAELRAYGDTYKMEIESGPFKMNMECAKECSRLHIKCIHKNWDDRTIARRFRHLMSKMIIIDKHRASFILTNLQEAVYDENSRESKLKKRSDQHGLDALMHMIHKYDTYGQVLSAQEKKYIKQLTKVVRR